MIDEKRKKILLDAMKDGYETKVLEKVKLFNELSKKYSQNIRPKIGSELKNNGLDFKISNLVPPNISENSYYYISLLEIFLNIHKNYRLLFQIRTLVLFPPDFNSYIEIDENKFIQLQYSNHTLILNSIFDWLLILVNRTLRLGIPDKDVRDNSLKKNYWVKKYEINETIGQVRSDIDNIRKESNSYRHKGELGVLDDFLEENKKINKIDIFKKLQRNEKLMFDSIIKITDSLLIAFRKWDSVIEKLNK